MYTPYLNSNQAKTIHVGGWNNLILQQFLIINDWITIENQNLEKKYSVFDITKIPGVFNVAQSLVFNVAQSLV
jgi:hypothetical protein